MFDTREKKLQFTSRRKAAGTATHSFSSALLEGQKLTADEEFDLKWSAASLYSGAWTRPSFKIFLNLTITIFLRRCRYGWGQSHNFHAPY